MPEKAQGTLIDDVQFQGLRINKLQYQTKNLKERSLKASRLGARPTETSAQTFLFTDM